MFPNLPYFYTSTSKAQDKKPIVVIRLSTPEIIDLI